MIETEQNLRVFMAEFSGTGNTRYLGALLEHTLKAAGHTVVRVAIEKQPVRPVLPDCNLVLIGAPVYHCAPPANVVRYVRSLAGGNLPLATYFSLALYSGDCARILQTHAETAGFRPIDNFEAKFPGSDFIALSGTNSIFVRMNRRITGNLKDKVRRFVAELEMEADTCKPAPKWYVPLNDLANHIAVPAYRRYKEKLHANPKACTQGHWCVAHCPVHAIRPDAQAVPSTHRSAYSACAVIMPVRTGPFTLQRVRETAPILDRRLPATTRLFRNTLQMTSPANQRRDHNESCQSRPSDYPYRRNVGTV